MKFHQIHVPKTGGTSLSFWARDAGLAWHYGEHKRFTEHDPQGATVVTVLRCPIKQTISVYSYLEKHRPKIKMQPFSQWIRGPKNHGNEWENKWFPNLYVAFFGNGDFEAAVRNLKSIDHVFDTAQLNTQVNDMAKKYGLPRFSTHVNTSAHFSISKDDEQYIRKHREKDIEICRAFGVRVLPA